MPLRAILLAAVLILAPLGARGADLVVWWEQGWYAQEDKAVEEIVAAFEQKTGRQIELVIPDYSRGVATRGAGRVARPRPSPPSLSVP